MSSGFNAVDVVTLIAMGASLAILLVAAVLDNARKLYKLRIRAENAELYAKKLEATLDIYRRVICTSRPGTNIPTEPARDLPVREGEMRGQRNESDQQVEQHQDRDHAHDNPSDTTKGLGHRERVYDPPNQPENQSDDEYPNEENK